MQSGNWYLRRGRLGRGAYWLEYVLPITALTVLARVADVALGFGQVADPYAAPGGFHWQWLYGPVSIAVWLLVLVPSVSAGVARLHDRGRSAWWLLLALIPVGGALVLAVDTLFGPGQTWDNDYGPRPALAPEFVPGFRPAGR